ncbi:P-type ATPase (P-ATPase) Superfamily [Achlya hypogyna]|uniref:Cation-transporting ATPase n=1 Tax=Achlya hypogyna TaxID=1202772 RepID=A0A1V9YP94_ACHHY|nr:P-type ATPase (P-ATPase) Superfamily [Achlya hypogyna]
MSTGRPRTSSSEDTQLLMAYERTRGVLRLGDGASIELQYLPPEYCSIHHYCPSVARSVGYVLIGIATFGIVPLVAHWLPRLYAVFKLAPASTSRDFRATDYVLLEHASGAWDLVRLHVEGDNRVYFEYHKNRYLYDKHLREFHRLSASIVDMTLATAVAHLATGHSDADVDTLMQVFGSNELDLGVQPVHEVLLHKVLHPFYVFQVVSVVLWLIEQYYTYALLILVMTVVSIVYEVSCQVTNMRKLQALVHNDTVVHVVRSGTIVPIAASALVIGDVVELEAGTIPADMVLLQGECTVDESSLTGEAIPVQKQSLTNPSVTISPALATAKKESTMYAGASILRHSSHARGYVLAIGFSTSKGELFRSIVCPKPVQFQVERDTYRFLSGLTLVAVLAGIKNAIDAASHGIVWWRILVSSLDLITIAVPPALPLILTVGVGFSLGRLQAQRIFCIDAPRINLAGHLDCFCFDKTGTLTTDHMVFEGVDLLVKTGLLTVTAVPTVVRHGIGVCHSVALHDDALVGSPLEREMLGAADHRLIGRHEIQCNASGAIFLRLHQFAFDAAVQRSSVIVRHGTVHSVYVKGSPEAVAAVCLPASVPTDFAAKVDQYARDGFYCLALAHRALENLPVAPQRASVEADLTFLGLLLFVNPIKDESFDVIRTLERAAIDVRMITGDNALTGIHVSRKLGLVDRPIQLLDVGDGGDVVVCDISQATHAVTPLVLGQLLHCELAVRPFVPVAADGGPQVTGPALQALQETLSPTDLNRLVVQAKIFARIRPDQKTWIIETLIAKGKYVGMVGDGTNDCGALKAAHVGLALSDAEASIVAPFTSRDKTIRDVLTLVKEGRCALMTSFLAFKYMVMYPVIQVVLTSTLYASMISLGNNQFLLDDMGIVLGLSMLMLQTEPSRVLTAHRPPATLFARPIVMSLAGHVGIYLTCFVALRVSLRSQAWYCSVADAQAGRPHCFAYVAPENDGYTRQSHDNTALWLFGHWAFVLVAVAMNLKDPFRQSVWANNKWFVAYTAIVAVALLLLSLTRVPAVLSLFELVDIPTAFRWQLLGLVVVHGLCSVAWEALVTRHGAYAPDVPMAKPSTTCVV